MGLLIDMNLRKLVIIFTVIMLISLTFAPVANSMKLTKQEEDKSIGAIIGGVFLCCFPPEPPIVGAKVKLEGDYLTRTKHTGLSGMFSFLAVEVGRQYTITVKHPLYVTESETFTITEDNPIYTTGIYMSKKDRSREINDIDDESYNIGKIEGKVMYAPLWTFSFPLPLATVKIGYQVDITKADGYYCMDGLKLNEEYTITYSHPQYKTKSFPITLTEDDPELELNLYFYDEDAKSREKNIESKSPNEDEECEFGSVSGSVSIHCFPPV